MAFAWATLQSPAGATQINAVWSGTANWTTTANWSLSPLTPAGFQYPDNDTPTAGDTYIANITTGSPTLNSKAIAIDALNLGANLTINAPGSLSLVSTSIPSTWSGGSIGGSGSFNIGSGVTLDLTTTAVRGTSATVNNNGIVSLTAGGDLSPVKGRKRDAAEFLSPTADHRAG